MARAHFVKKANKTIYANGKRVEYVSQKGKRKGETKSKIDRTIPADKNDKVVVEKGQSYWWWQFKGSSPTISLTKPKQSQLTRSGYLSQLYDLQDRLNGIREAVTEPDELQSFVDDIKSDLENLKEECENSLEAMPEHLQETSSSGELLRERIDSLDNAISELEGIDCDDFEEMDEDDIREELKDDVDASDVEEPDEEDPAHEDWDEDEARKKLVTDEMIEEFKREKIDEWLDEKCEEISNVSFD